MTNHLRPPSLECTSSKRKSSTPRWATSPGGKGAPEVRSGVAGSAVIARWGMDK